MSIITDLSDLLMIEESTLRAYVQTAPYRYKKYEIPKRNGTGTRLIAHPAKQLKFIQRAIIGKLEEKIKVHSSAMAYREAISIRENALIHSKSNYILKMDFENFFYSLTPELFFDVAKKQGFNVTEDDKFLLSHILFFKKTRQSELSLSIGAPSSPLVSNTCLYFFDQALSEYCNSNSISYSRYADDITFSTNTKDILFKIPSLVESYLEKFTASKVKVNSKKTVFSSKAHNRHVTGITLTNDDKISLGRAKKRLISAMVHNFKIGKLAEDEVQKLQGQLAFAKHIEPMFLARLERKYSEETLRKIKENR